MKLSLSGVDLSYREAGQGPSLLLLHAFPLHRGMFAPLLAYLSPHAHLLAPDLRGFGESRALLPAQSLDDYADDLAALLRTRAQGPAVVLGVSMGGYIAFSLARRHRDLLRALVLVDTKAGADSAEARNLRLDNARKLSAGEHPEFFSGLIPRLLGRRSLAERPGLAVTLRRMMDEASISGVASALRAMAERPDATPQLAGLALPTLVLTGAEDELTPPAEAARMAAQIPGARFVEIEGAGHLAPLEAPELVARALLPFLSGLR
jgi:pimeloyl-ACP methyl ester carboxylesterase